MEIYLAQLQRHTRMWKFILLSYRDLLEYGNLSCSATETYKNMEIYLAQLQRPTRIWKFILLSYRDLLEYGNLSCSATETY